MQLWRNNDVIYYSIKKMCLCSFRRWLVFLFGLIMTRFYRCNRTYVHCMRYCFYCVFSPQLTLFVYIVKARHINLSNSLSNYFASNFIHIEYAALLIALLTISTQTTRYGFGLRPYPMEMTDCISLL